MTTQVKIWGIWDIILQHSQYALVAMPPSSFVISPKGLTKCVCTWTRMQVLSISFLKKVYMCNDCIYSEELVDL